MEIPEEIVVIPMDATLIEQVLINLLENAVLHAAGMTELCLRVRVQGGKAVFEVADNGCGIPEEQLGALFSGLAPGAGAARGSGFRSARRSSGRTGEPSARRTGARAERSSALPCRRREKWMRKYDEQSI